MGEMLRNWVEKYGRGLMQPQQQAPRASSTPMTPEAFREASRVQPFTGFGASAQPVRSAFASERSKPKKKAMKDMSTVGDVVAGVDDNRLEKLAGILKEGGVDVDQAYSRMTGASPNDRLSRRQKMEVLAEFGLGLMQGGAPESGMSAAGAIAHGAQRAVTKVGDIRKQRRVDRALGAEEQRAARRERREERAQRFDMAATVERLEQGRKRLEQEGKTTAKFREFVGDDGYLYTYDQQSGEATPVTRNGKRVKPSAKYKQPEKRFEWEVKYNRYMEVFGKDQQGTDLSGEDRRRVEREAFKYANRTDSYTSADARRDAQKQAVTLLARDDEYQYAEPEVKRQMLRDLTAELADGIMPPQAPAQQGGVKPDASRLTEGVATAVTDEEGNTTWWTLRGGAPVQVSEEEME